MRSADDDRDARIRPAAVSWRPPSLPQRTGATLVVAALAALIAHLSLLQALLLASVLAALLLRVSPSSAWIRQQLRAVLAAARANDEGGGVALDKVKQPERTRTCHCTSHASDGGEQAAALRSPAPAAKSTAAEAATPAEPKAPPPAPPAATSGAHSTRRRSKLAAPTALTPSLRVVDMGVGPDGAPLRPDAPSEPLRDFVVEPNAETPYAFENDFVRGKLLFLLNRQDLDTGAALPARVERVFRGKRRLFWVQVQLQFKQAPSGIVYIGGEVPRAMSLGFFTGGLAKIILSVLQSLVRGLHYSFGVLYPGGAAATPADEELPHICFPLYTAVDQFVSTPGGAEPPALGSLDFGETKEAALARRKSDDAIYAYDTTSTYSFHFHSYFVDFSRWKLQSVPGMRDVDLRAFWSDMPLRLVAYSLKPQLFANTSTAAKRAVHSLRAKEYKFCLELSHRVQEPLYSADGLAATDGGNATTRVDAFDGGDAADSAAAGKDEVTPFDELQRELQRFELSLPAWFEYLSSSAIHGERRVGYVFLVREYDDECVIDDTSSSSSTPNHQHQQRQLKNEYMVLHTALCAYAPLSFIEHEIGAAPRKRGGGSVFGFASISTSHQSKKKHKRTIEESVSVRSRSNKYDKIEDERQFLEFHLKQLMRLSVAPTATTHSRVRSEQLFASQSALLDVLQSNTHTSLRGEWAFLSRSLCRVNNFGRSPSCTVGPSSPQSAREIKDAPHAAVQVVRVVAASRWRHEWVTLDRPNRVLRFFRMMASAHSFSIELDQVLSVSAANHPQLRAIRKGGRDSDDGGSAEGTGELFFWMHVESLEKCHHVAFDSRSERERWIASITETIEATTPLEVRSWSVMESRLQQPIVQSTERLTLDSFAGSGGGDRSPTSRGRFVLNDRCDFVVHAMTGGSHVSGEPNALVAQSLRCVLALQSRRLQAGSTRDLVAFLHGVSALQWIDVSSLSDDEDGKKVFFLNLFHLVQLHASVHGLLPKSKLHWSKFFNGASYNVGGLLFSLAEIEHCVIRAPMSALRLPIAFLVIPRFHHENDERAALQLTSKDFRLNFALNCMTKSCADSIAVFSLARLETQLDRVAQATVDLSLTYDRESRVVYLPKACDWYRGDFVSASSASEGGADVSSVNLSMLRLLVPFVGGNKRELLEYVVRHQDALVAKFKFTKYDYRFQEAPLKEAV